MTGPQLPPEHTKTYQVLQPLATHFRNASCMEVNCPHLERGWISAIDENTTLGQGQAYYIRHESGRRFTEYKGVLHTVVDDSGIETHQYVQSATGPITIFAFPPGQKCFEQHRVSLERPSRFIVKDGDVRGNPRGTPSRVLNSDNWVDDFANHQQALYDKHQEG